jgi:uncharacterized membrane protein YebE (DUF533 family)
MNHENVLTRILSHPASSGFAGGIAGGLLTSKSGRKFARKAAKLGGVAALGGLAYAAWQRSQATAQAPTPEPVRAPAPQTVNAPTPQAVRAPVAEPGRLPERFAPQAGCAEADALGRTLIEAMIAAAHADGRLDGEERRAIFDRVAELGLPAADQAELFAQLEHPPDLARIAAAARTREQAIEIYAASLLAVEVDSAAERGYLQLLAARLGLDDGLVAAIHAEAADDGETGAELGRGGPRAVA